MSNATAVSILAKLSGWYPFDGNLNDVHGSNTLTESVSAAGYSTGIKGQQIDSGSYGNHTLSTPVPITATTGQLTIGGWFNYAGAGSNNIPAFGFAYGPYSGNEAFKIIVNASGYLYLGTWGNAGLGYNVLDPMSGAISYPLTVRVQDADSRVATSQQIVRIAHSGGVLANGRYFIVGTWDNGTRTLYVDSLNVKSEPPPATVNKTALEWIGLGRSYPTNTPTNIGCDECFFSTNAVLNQAEITYLYNGGAGMSYTDLVAAAA